ncbi:S-adenosyl-L-methionine-dependent methyltransferase [Scenedesmus sp. NREL 46B-D3]|nr:S-adenosyl-L-methionine-dependent methyltransferase [Scenedesmus sp. NREL 46B-D3]
MTTVLYHEHWQTQGVSSTTKLPPCVQLRSLLQLQHMPAGNFSSSSNNSNSSSSSALMQWHRTTSTSSCCSSNVCNISEGLPAATSSSGGTQHAVFPAGVAAARSHLDSAPPAAADSASDTRSSSSSSGRQRPHSSLDKKEAAKFAALADKWWDTTGGPFAPLHALNTARVAFLRSGLCGLRGLQQQQAQAQPLRGLAVLDVGCGGGLLSEPVARLGAQVHGIDVSDEGVAAAAAHAAGDPLLSDRVRYQRTTLEALLATPGAAGSYDVVMASEVIEHVKQPGQFLADLAAAAAPGGHVFITTLNRTPAAYSLAIVAAEYLLRFVPPGTHDWHKFITPQELGMMAADAGLRLELVAGMSLQPDSGQFSLGQDTSINYAALLSKPGAA